MKFKNQLIVRHTLLIAFLLVFSISEAQLLQDKTKFTKLDTLRGSITPEREWWDLNYYNLNIKVQPDKKFIAGYNIIRYKVLKSHNVIQIDLQAPMEIVAISQDNEDLNYNKIGPAYFVFLKKDQIPGEYNELYVQYSGKPREAVRAPWDGGFSWKKDNNGKYFVATSCQGLGASVWWPNKDHMYDEVDSMRIAIDVPKDLIAVANGRLRDTYEYEVGGYKMYEWFVSNPINNYGVNVNIGDYVNFSEVYQGEKGDLDMDYWVLKDNLEKAKTHFKDAPKMMKAFEYWFGPYPFYEDSFKLVEVPYLGMEHQSSVTYGNKYLKGYLGKDLSDTGEGLKFDFIIVHEAGHEWFANNITNKDVADMWIHEGFTAYSENLFLDYYYGKKSSADYVIGTRRLIQNDRPLIGPYNVNKEGSSDMYYKGANLLHTLRQLIEDDDLWRDILRGLNSEFYHQTVTTKQIEDYISKRTKKDLSAFFNQYLRDTRIPTLEYKIEKRELKFRYIDIVKGFDMPIEVDMNGKTQWIFPSAKWQSKPINGTDFKVDRDYYIYTKQL
ncbi:M1 family metallopeptidase [Ichthyenterobacterium sp. W332]|uniref:M1 family metallopeptidase n=1 Tax=Microcosmobacter mediterraneus TaxID=3075607 RepID=A0ABU2YMV1_9FLAO|nr:M1 family metallopeptidase [Ichthyenterobacterium sp. W332]MDT0559142.1 M1 family metallopeptidase [Ichthyenterobacterium sp. W332]